MPFVFVDPAPDAADPMRAEQDLLALAAHGQPVAHLREMSRSLVVPRSYQRHAGMEAAREAFARQGSPVWYRLSGGGLVPQGPGLLDLSLAFPVRGTMSALSEAVYLHLCGILRAALAVVGVDAHWQAVEGSFCDGRFNLAWGPAERARKIAGTAQYWRRVGRGGELDNGEEGRGAQPLHVVLSHAVLLVSADTHEINARANAFEAAIGSGREYDARKIVTVREALSASGRPVPSDLDVRVRAALRACAAAMPWKGPA